MPALPALPALPAAPSALTAEHAEACVLLWPVRQVATTLPRVGLAELQRSDARLAAHLDGLRLAGAVGLDAVIADAAKEPGAAWAATILATEQGRLAELPAVSPEALWWMDTATFTLAASQRVQPGLALIAQATRASDSAAAKARVSALASDDPLMVIAACSAIAVAADRSALKAVRPLLGNGDPRIALAAARTVGLLGADAAAGDRLRQSPERADRLLAARCGGSPTSKRDKLLAIAGAGTVDRLPALLAALADPAVARLALEAIATITGLDPVEAQVTAPPPAGAPPPLSEDPAIDDTALDDDEDLPWPDVPAVTAWCKANLSRLPAGRLLGGKPVTACRELLTTGTQRLRCAAAIELVRTNAPWFPWAAAPAWHQRTLLASAPATVGAP